MSPNLRASCPNEVDFTLAAGHTSLAGTGGPASLRHRSPLICAHDARHFSRRPTLTRRATMVAQRRTRAAAAGGALTPPAASASCPRSNRRWPAAPQSAALQRRLLRPNAAQPPRMEAGAGRGRTAARRRAADLRRLPAKQQRGADRVRPATPRAGGAGPRVQGAAGAAHAAGHEGARLHLMRRRPTSSAVGGPYPRGIRAARPNVCSVSTPRGMHVSSS